MLVRKKGLKGYLVYRFSHNHTSLFSALGLELYFALCSEFLSLKPFQFFPSLPSFHFLAEIGKDMCLAIWSAKGNLKVYS